MDNGIIEKIINQLEYDLEKQNKVLLNLENLLKLPKDQFFVEVQKYGFTNIDELSLEMELYEELTNEEYSNITTLHLPNTLKKLLTTIISIKEWIENKKSECKTAIKEIQIKLGAFNTINNFYNRDEKVNNQDLINALEIITTFEFENNENEIYDIISEICYQMIESQKESERAYNENEIISEVVDDTTNEQVDVFEAAIDDITIEIAETEIPEIIIETNINTSENREQAIKYSQDIYIKFFYNKNNPNYLGYLPSVVEEYFELESDIKETDSIDKLEFAILIYNTITGINDNKKTDNEIKKLLQKLIFYNNLYDKNQEKIEILKNILENVIKYNNILNSLLSNPFYSAKFDEINNRKNILKMFIEQNAYNKYINYILTDEFIGRLNFDYQKATEDLDIFIEQIKGKSNQNLNNEKIKINSFVLFAESQDKHPYILIDLFDSTQKLIDPSANNGSDQMTYQQEISELIIDLYKLGKPKGIYSIDSSSQNYGEKMVNRICEKENGIVNWKKPTGMWRFRPSTRSNVRFAEKIIKIPKNTSLYEQITNIIKEVMPNVEITPENDFSIIFNIAIGLKKVDEEIYDKSIDRYNNNKIEMINLFYKNGEYQKRKESKSLEIKEKFTASECELFKSFVRKAIDTLEYISMQDPNYQFNELLNKKIEARKDEIYGL